MCNKTHHSIWYMSKTIPFPSFINFTEIGEYNYFSTNTTFSTTLISWIITHEFSNRGITVVFILGTFVWLTAEAVQLFKFESNFPTQPLAGEEWNQIVFGIKSS